MSLDTCAHCEYFQPGDDGVEFAEGECRVRSPHARWGFPQVSGDEWCGMFTRDQAMIDIEKTSPGREIQWQDVMAFSDPTSTL